MTVLFAPNKGGNWSFNYIGRIMAMYNEDISLANRWDTYDATNIWIRHYVVICTMKLDVECVD